MHTLGRAVLISKAQDRLILAASQLRSFATGAADSPAEVAYRRAVCVDRFSGVVFVEYVQSVGSTVDQLLQEKLVATSKSVRDFAVKSLTCGASGAHKWMKATDASPPQSLGCSPLEAVERAEKDWKAFWSRPAGGSLAEALAALKPRAMLL